MRGEGGREREREEMEESRPKRRAHVISRVSIESRADIPQLYSRTVQIYR